MRSTYLIAGAIVLALVAAGVLFGTDFFRKNPFSAQTPEEYLAEMAETAAQGGYALTFSNTDASAWQITAGHKLERFGLDQSGAAFARLSSGSPLSPDVIYLGLIGNLPAELNQRFNGKKVEVGIVARDPQANGAGQVSIVFATKQAGNSGWQKFRLTQSFQLYSFSYRIPRVAEGYHASPMVVVHADSAGHGKAVEILGIYVKAAPSGN